MTATTARTRRPDVSFRCLTLALLALALAATSASAQREIDLELQPVVSGLDRPIVITHAGDGSGRLFVVEQAGLIRVVDGGRLLERPFLNLRGETRSGGEQGLLGLAFHPDFPMDDRFYVHHTNLAGNTRLARYRVSADPDVADPGSRRILLEVPQFAGNHNGGQLAFGPDRMLYLALGDGGGGGDPRENGQDLSTLLGAILRLDVSAEPFAIPPDNPFVGVAGARAEIWVYGLRNPWRFSFDRVTGDLFIGDVGQGAWEEIDFQPRSSTGGENYGWDRMEGPDCFEPATGCEDPSLTLPILFYGRGEGSTVIAGYRYRGAAQPDLQGLFIYGDFGSGRIWGASRRADGSWAPRLLLQSGLAISTFGEDQAGELYLADYGGGRVLRLVDRSGGGGGGGGGCPWPVGHGNYCRDCGPCMAGEGDCDRDSECAPELRCAQDVGGGFGFNPRIDVCVEDGGDGGCPWPLGHGNYCRDCGPCAHEQGDCDRDSDCIDGTTCVDDVGARFGFGPGIDVCLRPVGVCPWPVGHGRFCRDCGPCAAGQGDCDRDSECVGDLRCVQNVGAEFGFGPGIDVCVPR